MSESQEDAEKKEPAQKKAEQTGTMQEATTETVPPSKPATQRPRIGTPIGTPTTSGATTVARPVVGTPVGSRPSVGTPVGSQQSAKEPPSGQTPHVAVPQRPPVAQGSPAKPSKPPESKAEISRRNFIKALAVLGGLVAVGEFVALGPYLQGSVGQSTISSQVLQDSNTGETLNTTSSKLSAPDSWTTFVYPRTGNPNIDNDTFRQAVIIHLPKGWSAGQYGDLDPISKDTFVALSRVCVHLWCLWSYDTQVDRGICPCHGSQYIPGGIAGSANSTEPGLAVAGPASLQTPPNIQLPVITLKIASDGTISATGVVGQIGCGLKC